jgi:hypothetical protein
MAHRDREAHHEKVLTNSRLACSGIGIANALPGLVQGAITSRDVFRHSLTILRLWGPACYVRCLKAIVSRRPCTFLEVISTRG